MGGIYWLASYPKSGNTWFRTVLSNYLSTTQEPVDINQLSTGSIASSRVWVDDILGVDTSDLTQDEIEALRPDVYRWSTKEAPEKTGYHKIHDAYTMLPDGRPLVDNVATLGAIYILRNPLDVVASLANHNNVDIDTAINQMADPNHCLARSHKKLSSQLLQRVGTWSQHVQSWVNAPKLNVMTLRYEDMHSQPIESFGAAFSFLGIDVDVGRLAQAVDYSRFDRLAAQEAEKGFRERPGRTQRFFRKGEVGDWRAVLTSKQAKQVIEDHHTIMRRFGYIGQSGFSN